MTYVNIYSAISHKSSAINISYPLQLVAAEPGWGVPTAVLGYCCDLFPFSSGCDLLQVISRIRLLEVGTSSTAPQSLCQRLASARAIANRVARH